MTGHGVEPQLAVDPRLRAKLARLRSPDQPNTEDESERSCEDTLLARIAWSRLVEPGDGTAGALLAALGPAPALRLLIEGVSSRAIAERAEAAGADLARRNLDEALDRWRPRLDRRATLGDIERAIAAGLRVIMPGDSCWPEGFADLGAHAPTVLWTRGDPALLRAPGLSVVGARAATGYGSHVTAEIVDGVCAAGIVIVSGAAYGIDAVAHRTALAAEAPTVAVLAGGADRAYPQAHDSLLERIGREGLVCAEMIPGSAPTKWRFRARNRLIAALTPATLVTEAGIRSGSINTAGHAATLGRALGAVPGPVTSAASTGCHLLIREYGAMLVANAREACELLDIGDQLELFGKERLDGVGGAAGAGEQRVPPVHERVLDAIPLRGGRTSDDIARRAGLSPTETRGALAELELLGRVRNAETAGGGELRWSLSR